MLRFAVGLICIIPWLVHCSSDPALVPPIDDAFAIEALTAASDAAPFANLDGARLHLRKSALGQPFLLTPTLVVASPHPIVEYLQPKVVYFALANDMLGLFETNASAIYDTLPSGKLLQTFSVDGQGASSDEIVFHWRYGLRTVPLTDPIENEPSEAAAVLTPVATFLREATLDKANNSLVLEQVSTAQLKDAQGTFGLGLEAGHLYDTELTATLRTELTPYAANPDFAPRPSRALTTLGVFNVKVARPHDKVSELLATRWDVSAPITYVISRGTPTHLVQAITEGVLYWNIVAQRDMVRVETEGADDLAPGPHRVIIHWIDWRDAAFSEASLQPDPLTGEILHASIFLTSAFDMDGLAIGRRASQRTDTQPRALTAAGFASARRCRGPQAGLGLLRVPVDPTLTTRVTQDYIRGVVAHEVGHTLGLRHNFAGSLASTLKDGAAQRAAWQAYLSHDDDPGAATSSTVMDYLDDEDAVLLGAAIRHLALPYDVAALHWLYDAAPAETTAATAPPFCTDGGARGAVVGCELWDSGPDPVTSWVSKLADHDALAQRFVNAFIGALAPRHPADRRNVTQAARALLAARIDSPWVTHAAHVYRALSPDVRDLRAELAWDAAPIWPRRAAIANDILARQRASMTAAGGLPGILQSAYPMDPNGQLQPGWLRRAVEARLNTPNFGRGYTLAGVEYELSSADIDAARAILPMVAEQIEAAYLRDILIALSGGVQLTRSVDPQPGNGGDPDAGDAASRVPRLAPGIVDGNWLERLTPALAQILLDKACSPVAESTLATSAPRAIFDRDVRQAAVRWLNPDFLPWHGDIATVAYTVLEERLRTYDKQFSNPVTTPAEVLRWQADERAVLKALAPLRLNTLDHDCQNSPKATPKTPCAQPGASPAASAPATDPLRAP